MLQQILRTLMTHTSTQACMDTHTQTHADTHIHTYTYTHTQTGFLIEFSNFPAECPSPLGCVPVGRSVCESVLAPAHTHTLTAMPQRYSYQKRKASTAAARRMERRGRDSGKTNNTNTSHSHRSKKLAMLSRYGICLLHTARQAG